MAQTTTIEFDLPKSEWDEIVTELATQDNGWKEGDDKDEFIVNMLMNWLINQKNVVKAERASHTAYQAALVTELDIPKQRKKVTKKP